MPIPYAGFHGKLNPKAPPLHEEIELEQASQSSAKGRVNFGGHIFLARCSGAYCTRPNVGIFSTNWLAEGIDKRSRAVATGAKDWEVSGSPALRQNNTLYSVDAENSARLPGTLLRPSQLLRMPYLTGKQAV